MSAIRDQIMENIYIEARNQAVNGTPMPKRTGEWAEFAAQALAGAILAQQMNPERPDSEKKKKGITLEARKAKLEANMRQLAVRQGISYEQWLKIAHSLYSIDGNYTVTSIARGPDFARTWANSSEIEAKEKIYELVKIKNRDHFERPERSGNFAYVPELPKEE